MGAEILACKSKRNEITARKASEYEYEARSESKERKRCRIAHVLGKWHCECRGFAHTGRAYKHIAAMKKLYDAKSPLLRRRAADTCAFAGSGGLAGRSRRRRSSAGSADRKSSAPRS